MSVYRPKGSETYVYDFQRGNRRFFGNTGERTKKAAEAVERDEIEKAEEFVRKQRRLKRQPMSLDVAFGRFWTEMGQYAASSIAIRFHLDFALGELGKNKRLDEITDDDISRLVAERRTHMVHAGKTEKGKPIFKPVENATVNRTIQTIRNVFHRAARNWSVLLISPPNWPDHELPEPRVRVREASLEEEGRLFEAVRDDYHDVLEFARVTGLRMNAIVTLTWAQIDFGTRTIRYQKKRKRAGEGVVWNTLPMSKAAEVILRRCAGHHESAVFTFVADRTRGKYVRGTRYPITPSGLKTRWRRDKKQSGVSDFRFHDWRHTAASRTLRSCNNLAVVQEMLGHEDVETTRKYAHVMQSDIANAMDRAEQDLQKARESREKSQDDQSRAG